VCDEIYIVDTSVLEELLSTYLNERDDDEKLKIEDVIRLCEITSGLSLLNSKTCTKSHRRFAARALAFGRDVDPGKRLCGAILINEIMRSGSNAVVSDCYARCAQLVVRLLRVSESEQCLCELLRAATSITQRVQDLDSNDVRKKFWNETLLKLPTKVINLARRRGGAVTSEVLKLLIAVLSHAPGGVFKNSSKVTEAFCCDAVLRDPRHAELSSKCISKLCIDADMTHGLLSRVVNSIRHVLRSSFSSQHTLQLEEDQEDRSALRLGEDENDDDKIHRDISVQFEFLCNIVSCVLRTRRRNWKTKGGGSNAVRLSLSALTRLIPALVAALDIPFAWVISGSTLDMGSKVLRSVQTSCLRLARVLFSCLSPSLRAVALRFADVLTRGVRNHIETPADIVNASARIGEWLKTSRQCMISFGLGVCDVFVNELLPCVLSCVEKDNEGEHTFNVDLAMFLRDTIAIASSKISENHFRRIQNLLLHCVPQLLEEEERYEDDVLISMLSALEYCLTCPCGHERVESLLSSASRIFLDAKLRCSDRPDVVQEAIRGGMSCERVMHPRCPPLRLVVSVAVDEVDKRNNKKKRSNVVVVKDDEESPIKRRRRVDDEVVSNDITFDQVMEKDKVVDSIVMKKKKEKMTKSIVVEKNFGVEKLQDNDDDDDDDDLPMIVDDDE